ncbi:MAG: CDP-alcohol phosphatidyltransferase family protein [Bacteroidota bacterium]
MSWYTEYKNSLKLGVVEEVLDIILYRPLAFLLVKVIYRTNITPNQLSIFAILMGLASGVSYAFGEPACIFAGALFYLAFNVCDCADGQLARLKNNGTPMGKIIDGIADYAATVAVFVGMAFGFANRQEDPAFWWKMLALTGLFIGIHSILVDFFRTRFLDYYYQRKGKFEESLIEFKKAYNIAKQKGRQLERIAIYIYLRYCSLQRFLVAKRKRTKTLHASPQEYYRKNRIIMRLWLLIGPTSQITNIILWSLLERIDMFMWVVLIGFNIYAAILWIIQQFIDFSYKSQPE